jgi:HPr kinase/phosphorylase
MIQVHGTCVAIGDAAVLLRGRPGSGKSDLALRLIDAGARLVADDYVEIDSCDGHLLASPPSTIAGLLEVRGLGIVRLPHVSRVPLALVIDLVAGEAVERLPEEQMEDFLGVSLRRLAFDPREASSPAKVHLAMGLVTGNIMLSQ